MSETSKPKMSKKKKIRTVLIIFLVVLAEFVLIFCLYKSPAKYVNDETGGVYVFPAGFKHEGEPYIYYTDLFGRDFTIENGKRSYHACPVFASKEPVSMTVEGQTFYLG